MKILGSNPVKININHFFAIKVISQETGIDLGAYEIGELCIRGPNIAEGYYNNEEATLITIDRERWLHSGDIGYYDKDGDFYIVGRSKELIKVGSWPVRNENLKTSGITRTVLNLV